MVSVVITTCKREPDILCRAMNSVLRQTYFDWEMLIVDDSPAEYALRETVKATVEQMAQANKQEGKIRIRYIAHAENQGACAARNTGLESASGEYIAYLDDDDEWLPEKLELQVQKAEEVGENVALIYCGSYVRKEGSEEAVVRRQEYHRGYIFDALILENFIGSTSFPLMRTKCLREIGGFDVLMQSAQDADVWLRLAALYEVDFVKEPLVCYHIHEGVRISTNIAKKIAGLERMNEKNQVYLDAHPLAFCIRNMKLARMYARDGQQIKALKIWWMAMLRCPWRIVENGKYLLRIIREKFRSMKR